MIKRNVKDDSAPGGSESGGGGRDLLLNYWDYQQRGNPTPAKSTSPRSTVRVNSESHYWLHVYEDGREQRFDDPPEFHPCKLVTICNESEEETFSRDPESWPPGRGWSRCGYTDSGFYLWRRARS